MAVIEGFGGIEEVEACVPPRVEIGGITELKVKPQKSSFGNFCEGAPSLDMFCDTSTGKLIERHIKCNSDGKLAVEWFAAPYAENSTPIEEPDMATIIPGTTKPKIFKDAFTRADFNISGAQDSTVVALIDAAIAEDSPEFTIKLKDGSEVTIAATNAETCSYSITQINNSTNGTFDGLDGGSGISDELKGKISESAPLDLTKTVVTTDGDLSTCANFQFEYYCDAAGNPFMLNGTAIS